MSHRDVTDCDDRPPLDRVDPPRAPESRTPYVLLLLTAIGIVTVTGRLLVRSAFAVELVLAAAAAAVAFAIWRFARQRQ